MTDEPARDELQREIKRLQRRLDRERHARMEAEQIAERATAEMYQAMQTAELLSGIAVIANEAPSLRAAILGCLERVCAHMGWPVGHALTVGDTEPRQAHSLGLWHLEDAIRFTEFRHQSETRTFVSGVGLPGRVLATGQPAWIRRVSDDPNFPRAPSARAAGLEAALAVPVLVRSDVRAILEFFSTSIVSIDEGLLALLAHVGAQLGRVVERDDAESSLTHLAMHDTLTGLPNRALLLERIAHARDRADRTGVSLDLLFLDIDDFKAVNDSLGHGAGDQMLVVLGERLQTCVRRSDTLSRLISPVVARLGGDEFAILLEDCADPGVVAARILEACAHAVVVEGREVLVAVSIGSARDEPGATVEELISRADMAMYSAKTRGKGRYVVFRPEMHDLVHRRQP